MKTKTIALKIHVTTEDGEVLESATIVAGDLDLSRPLDGQRIVDVCQREAASVYRDALGIAFSRAKKEATAVTDALKRAGLWPVEVKETER